MQESYNNNSSKDHCKGSCSCNYFRSCTVKIAGLARSRSACPPYIARECSPHTSGRAALVRCRKPSPESSLTSGLGGVTTMDR